MSRRMKVLIIEKDIRISPRIGEALERKGFTVVTSDDGLDGLETAKKEKPDLVILDFFLPNLDGYWVSAFIKRNKTLQKTKVLAFSSRTTPKMHRILEEAGIDLFVQVDDRARSEGEESKILEKLELLFPQMSSAGQK